MNPFVGGPGTAPPHLAGRRPLIDRLLNDVEVLRDGGVVQGVALYGPRGVGKTVALQEFLAQAREPGAIGLSVVARPDLEEGIVASLVHAVPEAVHDVPGLSRRAVNKLTTVVEQTRTKLGAGLVEFEVTTKHNAPGAPGLVLQDVVTALADVAAKAGQVVVITVDELQAANPRDLRALSSIIQLVNTKRLAVSITLAGLPNTMTRLGDAGASSFTERLDWRQITNLEPFETADAIGVPLQQHRIDITASQLRTAHDHSDGYPYAVQLLGRALYDLAEPSGRVEDSDITAAAQLMGDGLRDGVYRANWTKLSDKEQWYVAHVANTATTTGNAAVATRDLLESLGTTAAAVSTLRLAAINKGVLYAPRRGHLVFTVPGLGDWILDEHPNTLTGH